jgi:hypothetical protein
VERLIRPPDTADTEPRADRPMAYANDEAIVEVTARESEEDFPRDWPETKVDMADRRADVAATAPVLRTSAVPPSIRHDDDGPWWAFTSGFAAAVSGWPTESDGKAPARSKPGASRSRPAVERPRAARSASAAVAPKTRSRNSSEAPRDRIAAPARLRPMDVAPTSEPQLASRPAYTFHGCWTDEGHGRWSPCGGNGGGGGGGGGGE